MNLNLYWENQQHPHIQHNANLNKIEVNHADTVKQTYRHTFACDYCDAMFYNAEELHHHEQTHSRRRPYNCDECGSRFPYNSILVWHKKSHMSQLPFKCDECDAQFQQNTMLLWHKRKHRFEEAGSHNNVMTENTNLFYPHENNVLPYNMSSIFSVPNILSNSYNKQSNASRGIDLPGPSNSGETQNCSIIDSSETHEPDKLNTNTDIFRCTDCASTFKSSEFLKTHIQTKHNTGHNNPYYQVHKNSNWMMSTIKRKQYCEKPFKCDLCGVAFKQEGHLNFHRKSHTSSQPFKCDQCDQSFQSKSNLDFHISRHQPERPFKCRMCDASFHKQSQLQKHIERHT